MRRCPARTSRRRCRLRSRFGLGAALVGLTAALLAGSSAGRNLTTLLVAVIFPSVPTISADSLLALERNRVSATLIDARTEAEFQVSRIAGAIRVDPAEAALPELSNSAGGVIVYCSVGYRSSRLARRLTAAGLLAVSLRGGLFGWAARGLPMVDSTGAATRVVHPYGRSVQWLLPRALRAKESAEPR